MKLLVFGAPKWCGPCRMMEPIVAKLKEELPNLEVDEINIDKDGGAEQAVKYSVQSIPRFILLDDKGEVVDAVTGAMKLETLKEFVTKERK